MEFLRPQLLFGLFALAIPIIVHLFNFRRTKRVYFSNTKFLKQIKEASSSKLKLKHYLILLSRLLVIFFLVMAFAQPFIPSTSESGTSSKVNIYLDNSLSMSNEVSNGKTGLDAAIAHANKILNIYPPETSFKILTNGFESFSTSYKSNVEIEDYLTKIRYSGILRSADEILNRLNIGKESDSIDVYWISDFQQSTLEPPVSEELSNHRLSIIPVNFLSTSNVLLDSLYLKNPFSFGSEQLKLGVVLRNLSKFDVTSLGIKILIDEKQVATALVDIPSLGTHEVSFDIGYDLQKENKGRVTIEEYPVTFDNDLYFVINKLPKLKVLEIHNGKSGAYIKNVYANSQIFNFNSYNVANLNYSSISDYDLIIVNQLHEITTSLASVLKDKMMSNGSVVLIPSDEPVIDSYQLMSKLISEATTTEQMGLSVPDFNDPFFENVFEEKNPRFEMPRATPVLDLGSDRTSILKFQNGKPFMRKLESNLYALATPLNPKYGTLQSHALFVPVFYKLAVGSASFNERLYYYTDEDFLTFKKDSIQIDKVLTLVNESVELIPAQRIFNGNVIMELPKHELSAGYYQLTYEKEVLTNVAFNPPQKESNLEQLTGDELLKLFNNEVSILNVDDEIELENKLKNKYEGVPLWKLAIVLALVFLLAEVLLIRFFP